MCEKRYSVVLSLQYSVAASDEQEAKNKAIECFHDNYESYSDACFSIDVEED